MRPLALILLVAAGCASQRPAVPPAPAAPAAQQVPPPAPAEEPLALCSLLEGLSVEAYWSPTPWRKGERWIRIESGQPYGRLKPLQEPATKGCVETKKLAGPPWGAPILLACVPEPQVTEVEVTAEYACRLGAGRKRLAIRINANPMKAPGERLSLVQEATPRTPDVERVGGLELVTWRSREEVPAWAASAVPGDFDFGNEMLAGPDVAPSGYEYAGFVILGAQPAPTVEQPVRLPQGPFGTGQPGSQRPAILHRAEHVVIIDFYRPEPVCPVCSGVYRGPPREPIKHDPIRLWRLPTEPGVKVFEREHFSLCPPCYAP